MYDQQQQTNGVPLGVQCRRGILNGTLPNFWAATTLTEEDANWTRVWKCEIAGACIGGLHSTCVQGQDGPLCDSCADGYWGNPRKLDCRACPANVTVGNLQFRIMWTLIVACCGFAIGCFFSCALFKSHNFDQAMNFF